MFMRAHHIIAVVAVLSVGVGAKLILFTAPTAEADSLFIKDVSVDVSQIHQNAIGVAWSEARRRSRGGEP
jgi:hypothetical protein